MLYDKQLWIWWLIITSICCSHVWGQQYCWSWLDSLTCLRVGWLLAGRGWPWLRRPIWLGFAPCISHPPWCKVRETPKLQEAPTQNWYIVTSAVFYWLDKSPTLLAVMLISFSFHYLCFITWVYIPRSSSLVSFLQDQPRFKEWVDGVCLLGERNCKVTWQRTQIRMMEVKNWEGLSVVSQLPHCLVLQKSKLSFTGGSVTCPRLFSRMGTRV